ncbi:MAG TPA: hypothetical protein VGL72_29725 [Bryobacteraceae bacterium]|jgi:hypothetical protein
MHFRKTTVLSFLIGGIATCIPAAYAQSSGGFGGYTLGFVFDTRISALRPLSGIPGAATLGAPVDSGGPLRKAYVAPRQNYALALTDSGVVVVQFVSGADPAVVTPLGVDSSAACIVALSPSGAAAALYSPNEALVRIVTGLPGAPVLASSVPVGAVAGSIRLLAISNDAAVLIAVTHDSSSDSTSPDAVIVIDNNGNGQNLTNSTHVSALQFANDAHDLLLTDDSDNTLSIIQGLPDAAAYNVLADATAGISGPVAVSTSLTGNLVVANGGTANILVLDSGGAQIGAYPCLVAPTGLTRLNGNAVFLLNAVSNDNPLWLFDGDNSTPRVVFVPVDQTDSQGAGQ